MINGGLMKFLAPVLLLLSTAPLAHADSRTIPSATLVSWIEQLGRDADGFTGRLPDGEICTLHVEARGEDGIVLAIEGEHQQVLGSLAISARGEIPFQSTSDEETATDIYFIRQPDGSQTRLKLKTFQDFMDLEVSIRSAGSGDLQCAFDE